MIILTGGAGFIGSCFLRKLNDMGIEDIIIVDCLDTTEKWKNLVGKKFNDIIGKDSFINSLTQFEPLGIKAVFHFGACSSTTETNADFLIENNYSTSKKILQWSLYNGIDFLYASSAATYGDGTCGFSDSNENTLRLKPLNVYAYSKQLFDEYIIRKNLDNEVTGLKFFNVFGPNEYHKDNMLSMVYKAFYQVKETGRIKLFRSNDENIKDGYQKRDFVYVKDCVNMVWWLYENKIKGIFNIGSGRANSWLALAKAVFKALGEAEDIDFIDMPEVLKGKYQNFTQADITKLINAGYSGKFHTLEEAVKDYLQNHLLQKNQYY